MKELEKVECQECGKVEDLTWDKTHNDRLRADRRCFLCDFWREWERDHLNKNGVIVAGEAYVIASEDAGTMRGFGGRKFVIKYKADGRVVETTNLWHQGDVPKHRRDVLVDNAEFVTPENWHTPTNPD